MSAEPLPTADPSARAKVGRFFSLSLLANHFPELHGLRVLAVFSVLQWHVTSIMADRGYFQLVPSGRREAAIRFGMRSMTVFFGMDLFFVLSGFLIGSMLLHSASTSARTGAARGARGVLRFYARRAFRTFPLYYLVLTFLGFALPLTDAQRANRLWEYIYLTNYRPPVLEKTVVMLWGWSLCVEEHFYLLVPLLFAALHWVKSHKGRISLLVLLWLSALLIRLQIYGAQPFWTEAQHFQKFYIRTHTRFDPLVAGLLLAYVQHSFREPLRAWLSRAWARWLTGAVAAAALVLLLFPHEISDGPNLLVYRLFCWGTFTSVMYFAGLLLLLNTESAFKRFLSHRGFLLAATLGYGTYLVHIPVFEEWLMPTLGKLLLRGFGFVWVWLVGLLLLWLLSTAVAYLLHILVEKPMLALRDRWVA